MTSKAEHWLVDLSRDRRVTWMELFFDLIFVAAIAQVSSPLSADYSVPQLARYTLMFVLIWSGWCGQTFYSTRFNNDDLLQRIALIAQCFIAAVMAANARDALDSRVSAGFGAAYGGLRVILVFQYVRVRRIDRTRKLATRYATGYGVAAAIWIVSALMPTPARFWLWGLGFILDLLLPLLVLHEARKSPPHSAHLPERFGLFVVIVLGEFVAHVMRGIESHEDWSFPAAFTAIGSMAFAFALATSYFDTARADRERHMRGRSEEVRFYIWNYAHLPLCLAIGAAGAGFEHAVGAKTLAAWTRFDAESLCLTLAAVLASLMVLAFTSRGAFVARQLVLEIGILGVLLVFAGTERALSPLVLVWVGVAAGICFMVSEKSEISARPSSPQIRSLPTRSIHVSVR